MRELAEYLLKSGIWIAVFWAIYWFFLRRETFFRFNRFFLLAGLLLAWVLPFCQYRYTVFLDLRLLTVPSVGEDAVAEGVSVPSISIGSLLLGIYLVGAVVLLLRNLVGLNKIRLLRVRYGKENIASSKVVQLPEETSSFSFFGYVFMGASVAVSDTEKRLILEHETAHVEQRHWIDLVLVQFIAAAQWFNPFVWLYLRAVKQNHEFLADQSVLEKGNSVAVYHATLINYALKTPVFAFSNSFAYYNKFKRINMMKKQASHPAKKLVVLLLVPALAVFLWAFAKPEYRIVTSDDDREVAKQTITTTMSLSGDSVINKRTVIVHYNGKTDSVETVMKKENAGWKAYRDGEEMSMKNVKILMNGFTLSADSLTLSASADSLILFEGSPITITSQQLGGENNERIYTSKKQTIYSQLKGKINGIEGSDNSTDKKTKKVIINGREMENVDFVNPTTSNYINPDSIVSILVESQRTYGAASDKEDVSIIVHGKEKKLSDMPGLRKEILLLIDEKEKGHEELIKLSPDAIESVSVLKDQTSESLYGEKGKNGTIIVTTTKASKKEQQPTILRGRISDSNPLFIIDGKEFSDIDVAKLNPDDIASISILKDQTSESLYGEKGKNGVVIIETKEGAKKEKKKD